MRNTDRKRGLSFDGKTPPGLSLMIYKGCAQLLYTLVDNLEAVRNLAKAKKTQDKKAAEKAARVNGKKNATKAPKTTDKKPAPAKADKKAAPAPAPRPTYSKSHRLVEHEILSKAAGPMNAREISEIMVSAGQISGRTPQATVGRDLCMTPELFGKAARGKYVALAPDNGGKATPQNNRQVIIKGKKAGTLAAYTKKYKGNGNGKAAPVTPAPKAAPKPADKKTGNGKPKAAPKAAPKKTDKKSTKAPSKGA